MIPLISQYDMIHLTWLRSSSVGLPAPEGEEQLPAPEGEGQLPALENEEHLLALESEEQLPTRALTNLYVSTSAAVSGQFAEQPLSFLSLL